MCVCVCVGVCVSEIRWIRMWSEEGGVGWEKMLLAMVEKGGVERQ